MPPNKYTYETTERFLFNNSTISNMMVELLLMMPKYFAT